MTAFVASELAEWHASTSGISEYVFFNPQNPSTHIHSVKTAWHNALKLARIPRFPIYNCRHFFATRLAGLGVSDTIIDQLLRHARPRRDMLRLEMRSIYWKNCATLRQGGPVYPRFEAIGEPVEKGPTLINWLLSVAKMRHERSVISEAGGEGWSQNVQFAQWYSRK